MQYSSMLPKAGNRCVSEDKTIKKKERSGSTCAFSPAVTHLPIRAEPLSFVTKQTK